MFPKIERFCLNLKKEVSELLADQSIPLGIPVMHRSKTWKSISDNIQHKSLKLESVSELDDFAGLRMLLLFKRDIDKVTDLIRDNFKIVSEEDTAERLPETQFGYRSIHMVIMIPDDWQKVPSQKEFLGLKAELQIRTLSQHIWAAVSHELQYKREESVPIPVRRTIYRVSALLETVDLEFDRVLQERDSYISSLRRTESSAPLNVDLMRKILEDKLPSENWQQGDPYDELLGDLKSSEIETSGSLKKLIDKHLEEILDRDARYADALSHSLDGHAEVDGIKVGVRDDEDFDEFMDRARKGVYYTHSGLIRYMLAKEIIAE